MRLCWLGALTLLLLCGVPYSSSAQQSPKYELESCKYQGTVPPGLDERLNCDHYGKLDTGLDLEKMYAEGWRLIQIVRSNNTTWWVYLERPVVSNR